jgi:hypothetical protein
MARTKFKEIPGLQWLNADFKLDCAVGQCGFPCRCRGRNNLPLINADGADYEA